MESVYTIVQDGCNIMIYQDGVYINTLTPGEAAELAAGLECAVESYMKQYEDDLSEEAFMNDLEAESEQAYLEEQERLNEIAFSDNGYDDIPF